MLGILGVFGTMPNIIYLRDLFYNSRLQQRPGVCLFGAAIAALFYLVILMVGPIPEDNKALKLSEVPESYTDTSERKTYLKAYNQFFTKCIAGKDSKPVKCADGSHSAAQRAIKKGRDVKAGARNSALDLADIQVIHDKAFALGAKCKDDMEGKALDLERRVYKVRAAWQARFDPPRSTTPDEVMPMQFWVKAVFDDVVLVESMQSGDLFSYGYIIQDDGVVVFDNDPVQVEMELVEVGKTVPQKAIVKTCWTCAVTGHEHSTVSEAQACISQTTLNTPCVRTEFVKSLYSNNALKAISKTEDELVVANYLVLFDGRDLEGIASKRINADGSKGEYFTKATMLDSDYTETGQLLIDWEHRTQPDGPVSPDKEDIFGYVDWKTAIVDDAGLFVRRVLNRRNRYVKMLEALFDAGMIGSSTEPVQKEVVKGLDGEIKIWPLKRDSFSVWPMDWRMMTSNHLEVVKALHDDPAGAELYDTVFNQERSLAKARALSLINHIGEVL